MAFGRGYEDSAPEIWVVSTNDGQARKVMTLESDPELGPCPEAAWSPKAPVLAITNAACAPS